MFYNPTSTRKWGDGRLLYLLLALFLTLNKAFSQAPRTFPTGMDSAYLLEFRELEKFYDATNGDNWTGWTANNHWFTADLSTWKGLTIAPNPEPWRSTLPAITELMLDNSHLTGSLPKFGLPNLRKLVLSNNGLTGGIPDTLFTFMTGNLNRLDLSHNSLNDTIPNMPIIYGGYSGSVDDRKIINLSYNQLIGKIPGGGSWNCLHSYDMYEINFSHNKLSGDIGCLLLYGLKRLDLSYNELTGNVPNLLGFMWQTSNTEHYVNLSNNKLSGSLSGFNNGIGNRFNVYLTLNNNQFIFGDMDIQSNGIDGNWLSDPLFFKTYAPQANIPIKRDSTGKLSVTVGGTLAKELFKWYRNNILVDTIRGNNTYKPTQVGNYSCHITHDDITIPNDTSRNLILKSEVVSVTTCTIEAPPQYKTIGSQSSFVVNGHTYTTTGSYRDTFLRAGQCDSILETRLTVVPCDLSATVGLTTVPNQLACNILNGRAPYTYKWSNQATTALLNNVTVGNYAVTVTDSLGCTAVASFQVQNFYSFSTDVKCGGGLSTLNINMNARRECIDAMTIKIKFDTTKVKFDPTTITLVTRGTAIPPSGIISYRVSNDTLTITVDVSSGCISGDSATNLMKIPFIFNPTFAVANAIGYFSVTILEERITGNNVRGQYATQFQVEGSKIAQIQVFRPNNVLVKGGNRPISIQIGDSCNLLNKTAIFDTTTASVFVRVDSARYFSLTRPSLGTVPIGIIGGNDAYLMRQFVLGNLIPTAEHYQFLAADVNGDGEITTLDVTIVRRRAVGIYTNFYEYSLGKLKTDYRFVYRNNTQPVSNCYTLPTLPTTCDTPKVEMVMVVIGDVDGTSDTVANVVRSNPNQVEVRGGEDLIYVDFCKKQSINGEWKIPVYSNAITRGLDLHFLNTTISPSLIRVDTGRLPNLESNRIGQNFYAIGYSNDIGINSRDTLLYLYVKKADLKVQDLGNMIAYQNSNSVKVNTCYSTLTNDLYTTGFQVYPNPNNGMVQVTTTSTLIRNEELKIYDLIGRCVLNVPLAQGNSQFSIDMSHLVNGAYLLKIGQHHAKIFKQ